MSFLRSFTPTPTDHAEAIYEDLTRDLEALEKTCGVAYLSDPCIDAENVDPSVEQYTEQWWSDMYGCACAAAGYRAEEAGLSINDLLGRIIF